MEFRIAQIGDDPRGVLTGAFVFSPPPQLPREPRVLVERFGSENTRLGRHGWAVDSKGLRPRLIEKRGSELWLCFGAEVSFHVLPNTPVRVSVLDSDLEGTEIWPPIPRGKAPPADLADDDAPWPEPAPQPGPAKPEPAKPPPPPSPPPVVPPAVPPPLPPEEDTIRPAPPPGPGFGGLGGGKPPNRGWPIAAALALLVVLTGGGATWFFWPDQQPRPAPAPVPTPRPTPAPTPTPVPGPQAAACEDAQAVLAGSCPPDQLAQLSPEAQLRLAETLLGLGTPRADDLGFRLLGTAAGRHGPAQLRLGRLYDPASFRPGGPLSAPNPGRALELYGQAAAGGASEAEGLRNALIERLRREASGTDAAAGRARAALEAAGIR